MKKLEYKIPTVLNQGCCEEMLSRPDKSLNKNMKKAIPKLKPKLIDRNNLWWNDKFKILVGDLVFAKTTQRGKMHHKLTCAGWEHGVSI